MENPKDVSIEGKSAPEDQEDNISITTGDAFGGGKTISMMAGICLLVNNITGPGVPSIANMFAESGWVFPTLTFIIICILSSISTGLFVLFFY